MPKNTRKYTLGVAVPATPRPDSYRGATRVVVLTLVALALAASSCVCLRKPFAPPSLSFNPADWVATSQGDAERVVLSPSDSTLSIRLRGKPSLTGKGAVIAVTAAGVRLRPGSRLHLRASAPEGDVSLAAAVRTDQFYESRPQVISQTERDLVFDLSSADFKSARSQWQHTDRIAMEEPLHSVELVLYPAAGASRRVVLHAVELVGVRLPPPLRGRRTQPLTVLRINSPCRPVPQYGRCELSIRAMPACENPFDPAQMTVDAVFASPSHKTYTCPGFVYALSRGPGEADEWRVRFSPDEPGKWSAVVKITAGGKSQIAQHVHVKCVASDDPGPIRVAGSPPGYFEHADGSFFYPIGHNVCWNSLEQYRDQFAKMAANGENWSRVWVAPWNCEIEWSRRGHPGLGLGRYYLERAEKLDGILEAAEANGLYLQLVLHEHCRLSAKTNPEWQNNPYNKALGGPCATPQDFFTNEEARRLARNRLRYIVARWGYSSHVMAWELFNEVDLTDDFRFETDTPWHREMAGYIRSIDPHRRLITTSYISQPNAATYRLPQIDYTQSHVYVPDVASFFAQLHPMYASLGKPHFIGEFGRNSTDGVDAQDRHGRVLHAGLWAQFMVPSAGNAMSWWWYDHIDPHKLYHHFAALARFAKGFDRRRAAWSLQTGRLDLQDGRPVHVLALVSPAEIRAWLYDPEVLPWSDLPAMDRRPWTGELVVTNAGTGRWEIEHWDTYRGERIRVWTGNAAGGRLRLPVEAKGPDTAYILRREASAADEAPQLLLSAWDPRGPVPERKRCTIARAASPITVDGDLADWPRLEQVEVAPRDGRSPADNSFAFRAAHDGRNLYVAVRVRDDQLVRREKPGSTLWKDDGVEIWVDSRNDAGFFNNLPHNPGCFQIAIAPAAGRVGPADVVCYRNPKWNDVPFPGIKAVSALTSHGYVVEALIPLAAMRGGPAATNAIGFNVSTCDADLRDNQLQWKHLLWQGENEWNAMEWSVAELE